MRTTGLRWLWLGRRQPVSARHGDERAAGEADLDTSTAQPVGDPMLEARVASMLDQLAMQLPEGHELRVKLETTRAKYKTWNEELPACANLTLQGSPGVCFERIL